MDASIRATIGSARLLITIECRKRQATQDVTWIEQLASKRQAIGAARTIAVASTAFSSDAIGAAAFYGIDLRVLSEVTDLDVQGWILPRSVTHVFKQCDLLEQPEVIFYPESEDDSTPHEVAGEGSSVDAPHFIGPNGEALSLNDLWLRADEQLKIFDKIPADDKVHKLRLSIKPADELRFRTQRGLRRVHEIRMAVALRWQPEQLVLSDARVTTYAPGSTSDAMPTQVRAEFESKQAPTMNVRFGMQFEAGSDKAILTLEPRPGKRQRDG